MLIRRATLEDVPLLAQFNAQLLVDEGHRRRRTIEELEERMAGWLEGAYEAALFGLEHIDVGYALYRWDDDWVYLRQFYVVRAHRRQGYGRAAIDWLRAHTWRRATGVRLEVLVHNKQARVFYEELGFRPYAVTMEWMPPPSPTSKRG